ncbi:MAG: bifunctional phosphoribosyl-AMP cyclohydrolase/phosphoribosyl-ATP diphosphatase HisIE [Oscillochloridaceae bacterium umkhey_bin13]
MQFDAQGLIPAIVQHARSGEVLMLGYMNAESLRLTQTSGHVTFWSRSRQELWTKGVTSGNYLRLVAIRQDCDADALLVLAEPVGPTCHTGEWSCFHRDLEGAPATSVAPPSAVLSRLADLIQARRTAEPSESYTAKLLHGGVDRIGKKIGEEAAEVIIAAKNGSSAELTYEMADLLYHSLVLLENQGLSTEAIWQELTRRYQA